MTDDNMVQNTPAQEAFIQAQHDVWEEEKTWPIYEVVILGDAVEWAPRPDARYWEENDGVWEAKAADELPDDASLSENGHVVRTARAVVLCHARSEDHAKMLALRDNQDYHTVDSVRVVDAE